MFAKPLDAMRFVFDDLGRGSERTWAPVSSRAHLASESIILTLRLPLRGCSGSHFRRSLIRRVALVHVKIEDDWIENSMEVEVI